MAVQRSSACVALLVLALAGCSSTGGVADRRDECRGKRSSCMYEGAYEHGERDYAIEEAARLNKAELKRLRRSSR